MHYHSRTQRQLICRLAEVVCPPDPDPNQFAGEIGHHTQLSLRSFPAPARAALLAGLKTYDEGARVFLPAGGKPARDLDREVGGRYFASWWRSPIGVQRTFAKGIKGIICIAYYELPAVKAAIGYTPEAWIESVKKRRLAVYKEDIDNHAARLLDADPLGAFPLGGNDA